MDHGRILLARHQKPSCRNPLLCRIGLSRLFGLLRSAVYPATKSFPAQKPSPGSRYCPRPRYAGHRDTA
eukprot:scaffold303_cov410-Prasinococcus_capsulatus_cf.AAC.12